MVYAAYAGGAWVLGAGFERVGMAAALERAMCREGAEGASREA